MAPAVKPKKKSAWSSTALLSVGDCVVCGRACGASCCRRPRCRRDYRTVFHKTPPTPPPRPKGAPDGVPDGQKELFEGDR